MELKKYDKPLVVEELVFQVRPDLVDAYLEADYEIFATAMQEFDGYAGFEIWVSSTKPGYVRNIIFWDDMESLQNIDMDWVNKADQALKDRLGEENIQLVEASHTINQMHLVREFR